MELKEAIQLITHNDFSPRQKQVWADLGCGGGTFTLALASMLEAGSTIYAIDSNTSALNNIPDTHNQITLKKVVADFISDDLPFHRLDGMLMANSLHFVKNKVAFIEKLKNHLNTDAYFLVIEYDSDSPNSWVPYPLDYLSLKNLFNKSGYTNITKINTRASIYGNRQMYAALIKS